MTDTIAEISPEAEHDLAKPAPVAPVLDPLDELLADIDLSNLPSEDDEVIAALWADDPRDNTDTNTDSEPVAIKRLPLRFMMTVDEVESVSAERIRIGKERKAQREADELARTRKQSAERSRRYRETMKALGPARTPAARRRTRWAQRRLDALLKATTDSRDKFLQQLRGREALHVEYLEMVRACPAGTSDAKIAELLAVCRPEITKRTVRHIRANVAKLEQPGMPWHDLA